MQTHFNLNYSLKILFSILTHKISIQLYKRYVTLVLDIASSWTLLRLLTNPTWSLWTKSGSGCKNYDDHDKNAIFCAMLTNEKYILNARKIIFIEFYLVLKKMWNSRGIVAPPQFYAPLTYFTQFNKSSSSQNSNCIVVERRWRWCD